MSAGNQFNKAQGLAEVALKGSHSNLLLVAEKDGDVSFMDKLVLRPHVGFKNLIWHVFDGPSFIGAF